ncbi:hypothetical protein ACJX0J_036556, partial [Zea mays]
MHHEILVYNHWTQIKYIVYNMIEIHVNIINQPSRLQNMWNNIPIFVLLTSELLASLRFNTTQQALFIKPMAGGKGGIDLGGRPLVIPVDDGACSEAAYISVADGDDLDHMEPQKIQLIDDIAENG